ncbi:SusC/RagA family TonB-linked outer membrane protein [Tamlana sp. 2201CG12-4]|uniref:SusC/RagA family TonB-linked outer membrane protein n=1 Tax=Tamlana sp. 2201CG12-4 TaxID=3112582 RepID=UPI002DBFF09A|nr:SusC/RagA family TonB-linked outer membrane protein [Tamlana sp. 2201CG12-4]MEC3907213.1 SusC/RagA family TonB-linked outer membrane protein [Tamlana sp. 2201CG12-4]
MNSKINFLFILIVLIFIADLEAQNVRAIKILDAEKQLPVANAIIKTDSGLEVKSNKDGFVELDVNDVATIYIRKEGFKNLEIKTFNGIKPTYFLFSEDVNQMKDKFGAVWSSVKETDIDHSDLSFDINSRGKIAGVLIQQHSGMPGEGTEITIRGNNSLSLSNKPLLVVDGQIYQNDGYESPVFEGFYNNPYNLVNTHDIESVTFLKGSAAAMYGSLGSNGAILISTKRANELKTRIKVSSWQGISDIDHKIPLLNNEQWINKSLEVLQTDLTINEIYSAYPSLFNNPDNVGFHQYKYNTNWQDEIFRLAISQNYSAQVSGGDEVAKYYLGIGYNNNDGIVSNTNFTRYSTRFNTDVNISKDFKVKVNLGVNYNDGQLIDSGINNNNPIYAALFKSPILQPKKVNFEGEELPDYDPYHIFNVSNPLAILNDNESKYVGYSLLGNFDLSYQINDNFWVNGSIGHTSWKDEQHSFISGVTSNAIVPTYIYNNYANNQVKHFVAKNSSLHAEAKLGYNKSFHHANLNVVFGTRYLSNKYETIYSYGMNTSSDKFITLNQTNPNDFRDISSDFYERRLFSNYLTFDYMIKNKYNLSATINYEQNNGHASSISGGYLYGNLGASYDVGAEPWFSSNAFLDILRFRMDYGRSGNSRLHAGLTDKLYQPKNFSNVTGLVRKNIYNSNIDNEITSTFTFGVDLISDRETIALTIDAWRSTTKNLIVYNQTDNFIGFDGVYLNDAEMSATGIDLALNTKFNISKFNFAFGGNISNRMNKVTELGDNDMLVTSFNGGQKIIREGSSGYHFYGLKTEGVFIDADEATASNLINDSGYRYQAGDMKFTDITEDGIINDEDFVEIGDPTPDFFGGFYGRISYGNLSLNAQFSYVSGGDVYNFTRTLLEGQTSTVNQNRSVLRAWTNYGDVTDVPRVSYGDPALNNAFSDRWIEDGSYISLTDITLAYELPIKSNTLKRSKVFLKGRNIWTSTSYLGYSPEFNYNGNSLLQGVDYSKMPVPRSVIIGVEIEL